MDRHCFVFSKNLNISSIIVTILIVFFALRSCRGFFINVRLRTTGGVISRFQLLPNSTMADLHNRVHEIENVTDSCELIISEKTRLCLKELQLNDTHVCHVIADGDIITIRNVYSPRTSVAHSNKSSPMKRTSSHARLNKSNRPNGRSSSAGRGSIADLQRQRLALVRISREKPEENVTVRLSTSVKRILHRTGVTGCGVTLLLGKYHSMQMGKYRITGATGPIDMTGKPSWGQMSRRNIGTDGREPGVRSTVSGASNKQNHTFIDVHCAVELMYVPVSHRRHSDSPSDSSDSWGEDSAVLLQELGSNSSSCAFVADRAAKMARSLGMDVVGFSIGTGRNSSLTWSATHVHAALELQRYQTPPAVALAPAPSSLLAPPRQHFLIVR